MVKNKVDNISSCIPIDTSLYGYLLGSDGKISTIDVSAMSNIVQNDILVANIVIAAYLKCFGIDVATIAGDDISNNAHRIIDLRNILINGKWADTDITIKGVTKKANKWIAEQFSIYSVSDYVDELYRRVVDLVYNSDGDIDYSIIKMDNTTYQMIKLLAYCYEEDNDFSNIPVGTESIINIPFDKNHLDTIEDYLYGYLKDNGYINPDYVPSISFPQQLYDIFTNTPLDSDDYFQYCHIQILKSKSSGAWALYGYITHEEIEYLLTVPQYVHESGWSWNRTGFTVQCIPFTSDGAIDISNLCGFISSYNDGQRWCGLNMNSIYPVFISANSEAGSDYGEGNGCTVWCKRTNLTDGDNYYDYIRYNGNGTNGVCATGSTSFNYGIYMPYEFATQYGNQYRNLGTWDSDTGWASWNGGGRFTEEAPPTVDYIYDVTQCDKIDVLINNNHIGPAERVPSPTIDPSTLTDLDNRDLLNLNLIFLIYIDKDGISDLLKPTTTRVDVVNILHTKIIDISLGVDIDDGKPIDEIIEDAKYTYTPLFKTATIEYYNNGEFEMGLSPCELVSVINTIDDANKLNNYLWGNGWAAWETKMLDSNFTPMNAIESIKIFPFKLKAKTDYCVEPLELVIGNGHGTGAYCKKLRKYIKTLETTPIYVGGTQKVKIEYPTGGVTENEYNIDKGNFLDYTPYSSATIYIPFVGTQEVNLDLIMYRYIYLQYQVNLITGEFLVTLYSYHCDDDLIRDNNYLDDMRRFKRAYPVLTCTGNMAIDFPIAGKGTQDTLKQLGNIVGMLGNGFTGNVAGAVQSGLNIVKDTSTEMTIKKSNMSAHLGWMGNWRPFLTLFKHDSISGYRNDKNTAFNETKGMMTERGIAIKNMDRGFHIVSGVKMQALPHATNQEKAEIEQILKTGFYTSSEKNKSH